MTTIATAGTRLVKERTSAVKPRFNQMVNEIF